jgi:rhodanese-related sulfurtransferase
MESSTSSSIRRQWLWTWLLIIVGSLSCGDGKAEIIELTSSQFYEMATTGQVDVMLDVRTPEEWDTGHIENATLRAGLQTSLENSSDAVTTLKELRLWKCKSCRVVVYCRTGRRSGAALIELEAAGFDGELYNGLGVTQWIDAGYSLIFNTSSAEDGRCMILDQSEESSAISQQGGGSVCAVGATSSVNSFIISSASWVSVLSIHVVLVLLNSGCCPM